VQSAEKSRDQKRTRRALTLVEVLVAMVVLGIMITGIVSGFVQAHRTAEWSAYSLAAQSLAMQPIEQARAAKWDPYAYPPTNQLVAANFPPQTNVLDTPVSGTNVVYATNRTFLRMVSTNPPLMEVSVECTWRFANHGVFTNAITTYRAPDQ
jgi:prepilin-type N-terminal cleavage/methylation domain-containing protein